MRGSLYPDGVVVDRTALRRTETTKSAEILRNREDWTSRGVYTGGEIAVNGITDYHIDIAQFSGFAPNGEFIETTSAYMDLSLSDETANVVNFVLAIYTESELHYQPHETDGERYPTEASAAWRIRIYTEAEYNALAATDSNLANDAKDRCLLLGKVTANGAATTLTASSIESPTVYSNILYASPLTFTAIPGVQILSVSSDTPVGDGVLSYTYAVGPVYTFTWTTSNGVGVALVPVIDGIYNLEDGAGASLRIQLGLSLLPVAGTFPMLETVTIFNLYNQDVPRLTGEDLLHRNYIGTGTPTVNNPHGLSMDDILADQFTFLEEHQDKEHCNGIWKGSNAGVLATSVQTATPGINTVDIASPVGSDTYYVNGQKLDSIDVTNVSFGVPAVQSTYFYEIYVSDEGSVEYVQKAAYPILAPRTVSGTWIVDMSSDYPAASYNLKVVGTPTGYTFTWDNGKGVLLTLGTDSSQVIRLYADDGSRWIDLYVNMAAGPIDENLPGVGTFTDAITVVASLDLGQNMQIASTPYWYDTPGAAWIVGYPPQLASRFLVDKRPWGTLCVDEMSDSALEEISYDPADELGKSGVLLRRNGYNNEFRLSNKVAFTADISGGSYYSRGKRLTADALTNLVFAPSAISIVWASWDGVVQVTSVSAVFSGDITAAMRWIMGSMVDTPPNTSIYHADDQVDSPERGVLLWFVVTDGAGITYDCDFSRNVNQVEHPWSICGREATYAAQAAFDSLYTAFEYAKNDMLRNPYRTGTISMYITGTTTVDLEITQPSNVEVLGVRGSVSSLAQVKVTHVAVAGAWNLSQGCRVAHVNIVNFADGGTVFALGSGVTIEGCDYSTDAAVTSDGLASLYNGSSIAKVRIRDNRINTKGGMFLNTTAIASGYTDFEITGNTILVSPGSTVSAIYMQAAGFAKIERNFIVMVDSDDTAVAAIQVQSDGVPLYQTNSIFIKDNLLWIDDANPAQAVSPYGVYLADVEDAEVSGNTILAGVGFSTTIGIGVWVQDCTRVSVRDNSFENCGEGVRVVGSFYDVGVCSNKFVGCMHKGVRVSSVSYPVSNSVYGLRIEDNEMNDFTKGSVGGTAWSADLVGVELDFTSLVTADSAVYGISVSGNAMHNFVSGVNRVLGIYLDVDTNANTVAKNFTFDNNRMSQFLTSSGNMRGIYLEGSAAMSNRAPKLVSISGNHLFFEVNDAVNRQAGIEVHCYLMDSSISNNDIVVRSSTATSNGNGIDVGRGSTPRRSTDLVVSGNKIDAVVAAMYLRLQDSLISGNNLRATSVGAYINLSRSTFDGNFVSVEGYSDNPYLATGGGAGSHCIVSADAADFAESFVISNCQCRLEGNYAGVANELGAGSSCINIEDVDRFEIIGCKTWSDARTLAAGQAEHIHVRLARPAGGSVHFAIKGCTVENTEGASPSKLSGIYIERGAFVSGTDTVAAHIDGNTIYGSITGGAGNVHNSAADPAAFPYELAQDLVASGVAAEYIMYTGNVITLDTIGVVTADVHTAWGDAYNGSNSTWQANWW